VTKHDCGYAVNPYGRIDIRPRGGHLGFPLRETVLGRRAHIDAPLRIPDPVTAILRTRAELRAAIEPETVGLVPTMGALHEGHLALIRRSAEENEQTVVSVFVNPTQFNDPADLAAYPRDFKRDTQLTFEAGASFIYAPDVSEVYPEGFATAVEVAGLTDRWEGAARPGHFRGVATVVTILLNSVRPARSYFGEKDFQQLVVVRRLHRDLALLGEIVGCPTVREADGLALSSRNARLDPREREAAAMIPFALLMLWESCDRGELRSGHLLRAGQLLLGGTSEVKLDYLAIVDPENLEPVSTVSPGTRAIIAARVGPVRLIDNMELLPSTDKR
jgi:pantoate--beta-alanine ligase